MGGGYNYVVEHHTEVIHLQKRKELSGGGWGWGWVGVCF